MKKCPLFKTECKEHGCAWYINVLGAHPQSGEQVNEWDCSMNWLPVLLIDVGRQARSGAAATESFRNAVLAPRAPQIARADVVIDALPSPT